MVKTLVTIAALAAAALFSGCARHGRLVQSTADVSWAIPDNLPDRTLDRNPRFLVYGDNRPGWRLFEAFAKKRAWLTWKQLYLPGVYQLYWLGSGLVGGVNYARHSPDYGGNQARLVRDALYADARRYDVDFVVSLGDMATDGRRPAHWKRFVSQVRDDVPLATEFAFLPVIGNHEIANDSTFGMANFRAVFSYPSFYMVEAPAVDFFFVDSDVILDQDGLIDDAVQDQLFREWFISDDPEKPAWLERVLADSKKRYKVLFMHHPPLSFARHRDDWTTPGFGPDAAGKRDRLIALFNRTAVDIVFSGHQHMYERSVLRFTGPGGAARNLYIIVSGGGGSPLQGGYGPNDIARCQVEYRGDGFDVVCAEQKSIYNYCLVEVSDDVLSVKVFEPSMGAPPRLVDELAIAGDAAP